MLIKKYIIINFIIKQKRLRNNFSNESNEHIDINKSDY